MEIQLLCIGKTDRSFWSDAVAEYEKRLQHYVKFSIVFLPDVKAHKKTNSTKIKTSETERILQKIKKDDQVILLDEKGETHTSASFAKTIVSYMNSGKRRIIFIVGGAYGFSDLMYERFPLRMALSKMTFSHQMARLFFCEQLYRAFTIINNHPYHNK